jgi:hypothetical protein
MGNIPLESKPRGKMLPARYAPPGGTPYRVQDGDDWNRVANKFGVNVQDLILFNFETLRTNEVNWYLRRNVGCVEPSPKGFNWAFSKRAHPGIVYIPPRAAAGPFTIQLQQYTYSIATFSWIDPRTNLLEVDDGGDPGDVIDRDAILANSGYRFANFLEATISVTNANIGQVVLVGNHIGYTKDSGIYRAPSFLGIPSYAYPIKLIEPLHIAGGIEFRQIVGARTQSAEVAASKLGGPLGAAIAQKIFDLPPIWTDLKLTIRYDGTYSGDLVAYSLFPSLTFYENSMATCIGLGSKSACQAFEKKFGYDGMPNYARWYKQGKGWGPLNGGSTPSEGNPWGAMEPDRGAIFGDPQPDPNEVVRRPTTYPPQSWLPGRQ